jgi:hypothetical protein
MNKMSWLNLGNDENRKYKIGDIVEDKWERKGKIIALRGCSCCGQLYEVENIPGYIVEGNLKGKVVEEIPQFERTLEQLDNLCNIKSKGE